MCRPSRPQPISQAVGNRVVLSACQPWLEHYQTISRGRIRTVHMSLNKGSPPAPLRPLV